MCSGSVEARYTIVCERLQTEREAAAGRYVAYWPRLYNFMFACVALLRLYMVWGQAGCVHGCHVVLQ